MADSVDGTNLGLFEPVSPPRYPISSTSQGGYAFIASLLVVLISGLTVLVKLHMTASTFRKLRRDDIALTGALVRRLWPTFALTPHSRADVHRFSRLRIQFRSAEA